MLTFEIVVTEEDIILSDEGESVFLHASLEALEAQALAGLDRDGSPLIGSKGQRLDLHQSGALWRNVTEAPGAGGLVFEVPYAAVVLQKYKADGLNDASLSGLEERLKPVFDQQVTNKEVK